MPKRVVVTSDGTTWGTMVHVDGKPFDVSLRRVTYSVGVDADGNHGFAVLTMELDGSDIEFILDGNLVERDEQGRAAS